MRKQLARNILAAATVTAALCLTAPAAMASGTWTVTGGTNFTATQTSGSTFTFTDTTEGLTIGCTVATAKGTVTDQSHGTNLTVGTITGSTFGSSAIKCNGPFGTTVTITQKPGTSMTMNVRSYDPITGVTTGTFSNVDWILSDSLPCSAEVKGTAAFHYANSSASFAFIITGASLQVTSSSCPFFRVNDAIGLSGLGRLTVTGSPVNPILVSQP